MNFDLLNLHYPWDLIFEYILDRHSNFTILVFYLFWEYPFPPTNKERRPYHTQLGMPRNSLNLSLSRYERLQQSTDKIHVHHFSLYDQLL